GANLSQVRAVRFTFDDTNTDEIYIPNIRASSAGAATGFAPTAALPADDTALTLDTQVEQNAVSSMTASPSSSALGNGPGVEISLTSNRSFLPAGEILVLRIADQEFDVSRVRRRRIDQPDHIRADAKRVRLADAGRADQHPVRPRRQWQRLAIRRD